MVQLFLVKANSDCTPGNQIFQCLNGVPHVSIFKSIDILSKPNVHQVKE